MKGLWRRSGATTMRNFLAVKFAVPSRIRERGSKAMHPSRILSRISLVAVVSFCTRNSCRTIRLLQQSEWKRPCSAQKLFRCENRTPSKIRYGQLAACRNPSNGASNYCYEPQKQHRRGKRRAESTNLLHVGHLRDSRGWLSPR